MIAEILRRWVAPVVALTLLAAAPAPVKTQVPGYFRYAVGNFEVTALSDGYLRLSPSLLHGVDARAVPPLLERQFADVNDKGILTSVNAFLVNTGDHLILVDAGLKTCVGEPLGHVTDNLRAAGYRPEDVDAVLITHMHNDHICGLVAGDQRAFPNATVYAAEDEAAYWLADLSPDNHRNDRAHQVLAPYRAANAFRTFKPGAVLFPGVTAVDTRGHTPGHTSYLFESGPQKLLVLGDIVHVAAVQFRRPEATMEFDVDQKMAGMARASLLPRIVKQGWAVAGAHLPFPGIGHLRKENGAYVYVPVEYAPMP
jgi:glyoxylase-like metal-dependent hydrolase (beta-lactamase superfamily II)